VTAAKFKPLIIVQVQVKVIFAPDCQSVCIGVGPPDFSIVANLTVAAIAFQRPLFADLLPSKGCSYISLLSGRCLALGVATAVFSELLPSKGCSYICLLSGRCLALGVATAVFFQSYYPAKVVLIFACLVAVA
jgi:hypothetical protein